MFDYAGAVHFHSAYSYDARSPLPEILQSGLRCGLDFAVLTDHFRLDALKEGWEGYHPRTEAGSRILLLVGEEISPRYNHYLAFNIKEPVVMSKLQLEPQRMIDAVREQGGFGFIAHPDHSGAPLVGVRAYPWLAWETTGYAGLGIWDLMGDWSRALSSPWSILFATLWPALALQGPRRETLERWDRLAQSGPVMAIGEVDNHANDKSFWGFKKRIFSWDFAFRTIRTHVILPTALSGRVDADRPAVLDALRLGHSYISFDLWQNPKGFAFHVLDGEHRAGMGDTFERRGPALIEAKLPLPGRMRLIHNGHILHEERRRPHFELDLDRPGVYRVEAFQHKGGRWRPWIFSNPIWVK